MAHLRKHFNLLDDDSGDYGIEIDPREADWSTMGLLRELGFNRVSIGLQDLDPAVQRAVNRLQSLEETRAVIDAARTLQFRSINIDLIYGLPKQTPGELRPHRRRGHQPATGPALGVQLRPPAGTLHAATADQRQ